MTRTRRAVVLGGSGYAGAELLRLLAVHPHIEVVAVAGASASGKAVADLYPGLAGAYPQLTFEAIDPALAEGADIVFCALPHGQSQSIMADLMKRAEAVVDLAADFRLKDADLYPQWYGEAHAVPELLNQAAFGIPELFRDEITGASLVAAAGCYVTAAALPLAPLVRRGLIDPTGIVVDAASGASGAGRNPSDITHFGAVSENFNAYGLVNHRHTPEMEQAVGGGAQILFTPHLAPMNRGILATCYTRPADGAALTTNILLATLESFYVDDPFVFVSDVSPGTKSTLGSNAARLSARFDARTGWAVLLCALDNLTKGAAGQAIQCANLALGLKETAGLPTIGLVP